MNKGEIAYNATLAGLTEVPAMRAIVGVATLIVNHRMRPAGSAL